MLSELFKSRARIQILRDGPRGLLLEGFAQCLSEAGYATITARKHLRAAEHFIHFINWNDRHSPPERKLNKQSLVRFERHLSRCQCQQYSHASPQKVVHGVHLFLSHLRDTGIINLPWAPNHDPALLSAFCQWMHQQRGISDVTLSTYSIYIRELLRRIGDQPSRFNTRRLREFVLEKSRSWGRGAAKNCTTAVRMFLRFLIAEGQCAVGLDAAIPTLAHWRLASLPRYLPPEDVERLIASCDRASAVGRRDQAILLLLARVGLRAGDIVRLRLSDVDWKTASIQVCGKGRRHTRLPLTREVGQAIVAYLKKGRTRTNADALFIRCRAPFCAFKGPAAISDLVDKALRRAGVMRPSRGAAHLLRHSLATSMLWQGASLEDIGAVLRHSSVETTQIYAKVDIPTLRKIAQTWPEV
jgi:site-specific recombinase XerD